MQIMSHSCSCMLTSISSSSITTTTTTTTPPAQPPRSLPYDSSIDSSKPSSPKSAI